MEAQCKVIPKHADKLNVNDNNSTVIGDISFWPFSVFEIQLKVYQHSQANKQMLTYNMKNIINWIHESLKKKKF